MKAEWIYLFLIMILFVVPRFMQRFRIPSAITSFLGGTACAFFFPQLQTDSVIQLFSMLGIVSLFLFAGLELPLKEIQSGEPILIQHLLILALVFIGISWLCFLLFGLEFRISSLMALALVTPSTGFILASINSFHLDPKERTWVKTMAVAGEILALAGLFIILQSTSWLRLSGSILLLFALVVLVPWFFRGFIKLVLPYAPRSEFAFLLMLALFCAAITKYLGVYYLVGAFVVGVAAQRFQGVSPELSSTRMLDSIELFASFFIPFYFFRAGFQMSGESLSFSAAAIGITFLLVVVPIRLVWVALHRWTAFQERFHHGAKIASCLIPTLVFTLVISEILRERFHVDQVLLGGLLIYALANTLVPTLVFHTPPPEYMAPHLEEAK